MSWRLLVVGGAALAAGCVDLDPGEIDTGSAAIVGGAADTGDPAVAYLSIVVDGVGAACSGTLISPRVVLTAAHCVDLGGTPTSQTAYFGTNQGTDPGHIETIEIVDRIWFEPWDIQDVNTANDIGMVLLAHDAMTEPVPINRTQLTNADFGEPIRLVGWGNTSGSGGAGTKRQVTTPLASFWSARVLRYGDSDSNTCQGDSGGPGFMTINGTEVVAGVTSFGFAGCTGDSGSTNVARYVDFIDNWVETHDVAMPPTAQIVRPVDGATVSGGFAIQVDATDDTRVERVDIMIDGEVAMTGTLAPFVFNAPDLPDGDVVIEARAYDNRGAMTSDTVTVTIGEGCSGDDCSDGGGGCATAGQRTGVNAALAIALAACLAARRARRRRI